MKFAGYLYKIILIAAMLAITGVSGGKTAVISGLMLLFAVAYSIAEKRIKAKQKMVVLLGFTFVFAALNIYFNALSLKRILPMNYVKNQHFFQGEFKDGQVQADGAAESMAMPDAYLRELIRYKTVAVPYEVQEYSVYNPILDEEERGHGFVADYYFENNYTRYFMEYSQKAYCDLALPKLDNTPECIEDIKDEFTLVGVTNDMLRYSFLLNQEHSKETKYFWYSWYYYSFAEEENHYPRLYVNLQDCEEHDELVAIWDREENLYLMSRERYEAL